MPDEDCGFYQKYTVERTDGSSRPGERHHNCVYFVLDIEHDPFAHPALEAYITACADSLPQLSSDLKAMLGCLQNRTTNKVNERRWRVREHLLAFPGILLSELANSLGIPLSVVLSDIGLMVARGNLAYSSESGWLAGPVGIEGIIAHPDPAGPAGPVNSEN
jgi:hypothetical protein